MRRFHRPAWMLLALLVAGLAFTVSRPGRAEDAAQDTPKPAALPVRTYRIEDLFLKRDWSAGSIYLPDVLEVGDVTMAEDWAAGAGTFGDLFGPSDRTEVPMNWQELIDIIQRAVNSSTDPKVAAWASEEHDEGGPAVIGFITLSKASILIVAQTEHAHKRIDALLDALRGESEVGGPMLTIHARWVQVEDDKAADLLGRDPKRKGPREVTAADLEKAGARTVYRGATTTFDHMKVFISAGQLKTYVADVEPVVADACVGVDPTFGAMIVGALLEVQPWLSKKGDTVLLDYRSYVNHAGRIERRPLPEFGMLEGNRAGMRLDVDLAEVEFQTLRGSVRIPLDTTVLLGLTTGPKLADGKVYALVVEVSASK